MYQLFLINIMSVYLLGEHSQQFFGRGEQRGLKAAAHSCTSRSEICFCKQKLVKRWMINEAVATSAPCVSKCSYARPWLAWQINTDPNQLLDQILRIYCSYSWWPEGQGHQSKSCRAHKHIQSICALFIYCLYILRLLPSVLWNYYFIFLCW